MTTKIAIIHYSMYGHVATMSEAVKRGILASGVASCDIFQVAETLPSDVLEKMYAPPKGDYPIITKDQLPEYDGFLFGVSGRFGTVSAQMKAFMDSTGSLWQSGALVGKPAGVFFSTAVPGGGQEAIGLTIIPYFASMGMVYVPLGYADPNMFNLEEVHGSSPYGAGSYAASDGSRQPSELEKGIAETQGKNFAGIASRLKKVEL